MHYPPHSTSIFKFAFLGNGIQYRYIGDMYGVSKSTVSCVVKKITKSINDVFFIQLKRRPPIWFL